MLLERDFKGIWIPKEIWLNKELTTTEKLFLIEIDSLDNEKGCFASNDYFSEFFGLSKSRCSEIIHALEQKGILSIELKYKIGSKLVEKRIIKVFENSKGYSENRIGGIRNIERVFDKSKGYSEKEIDNNTLINNTLSNINKDKGIKKTNYDLIVDSYTTNQDLKNTIYDFIKMRKAIKANLTDNALKLILGKLDKLETKDSKKIEILENSIMNSWKGIFELKEGNNGNGVRSTQQNTGQSKKFNIKPTETIELTEEERRRAATEII